MADKDIEKLVAKLKKLGVQVDKTGKNYYAVYDPHDGEYLLRIPSTPSSRHTINRVVSRLRKAGIEV